MPDTPLLLDPVLQIDEIQGNILGGFNKDHQAILPMFFESSAAAVAAVRRWLANLVPQLTWLREVAGYRHDRRRRLLAGGSRAETPVVWRNLAFSHPGLRKLTPQADAFDAIFRGGLPAASARLGDPIESGAPGNPSTWVVGGPGAIPDLLVIIAGDIPEDVESEVDEFLSRADAAGIRCPRHDVGHDLSFYGGGGAPFPSGREHFGFKDGVSQPGVRGRLSDAPGLFLTPRVVPDPDPGSSSAEFSIRNEPLVSVGEFVLGYPRQNASLGRRVAPPWKLGPEPFAPDPSAVAPYWARNGSFLVYRRLAQDVPAFNQFLADEAARLAQRPGFVGLKADRLGALLVGRWHSGAPVLRSPAADSPTLGASPGANNAFRYDTTPDPHDGFASPIDDAQGEVCPQAAHIRKVNPRSLGTDQGSPNATLTRRILRRGIPFGPPLPIGSIIDPEPTERGLLFLSYQASIRDQFEFLAADWMNDDAKPTNQFAPLDGSGYDMILGQASSEPKRDRFCLLGPTNERISTAGRPRNQWVIATGGGYFFAPSRKALRDVLIGADVARS
jgi:Dyp-type peroxidase family